MHQTDDRGGVMTEFKCGLRYPGVICIGAQKAGTTWLHKMLRQHPDVWLPPIKEVHFFDRVHDRDRVRRAPTALDRGRMKTALNAIGWTLDSGRNAGDIVDQVYCLALLGVGELSDNWYGRIFQCAFGKLLCGEVTPEYALLGEQGIRHMLELCPGVKLIFLMRDPIERGWSHLRMNFRKTSRKIEADQITRPNFVAYSDYMTTIDRFHRHMPSERFLQLYFDDIVERPLNLMNEVCSFLELETKKVCFDHLSERFHSGDDVEMEPEIYDKFREVFRPVYERLRGLKTEPVQRWYRRHYGDETTS